MEEIQVRDGTSLRIEELNTNPGFSALMNFTGITSFQGLNITERYEGNPAHSVLLQLWNYSSQAWETILDVDEADELNNHTIYFPDATNFLNTTTSG